MSYSPDTTLGRLLSPLRGSILELEVLPTVVLPPSLATGEAPPSRAVIALAMNLILFADLLARAPSGRAYVADVRRAGGAIQFDHGALRTVDLAGMGDLPRGERAITRVLEPLGYALAGTYPLDRLKMTGRAYAHLDHAEELPQFFVSELHVDRFSPQFGQAALRVTQSSVDPLDGAGKASLARLQADGALPLDEAQALLPKLVGCFARRHAPPSLRDYEILLAESAEMAWIATEGNAFNHATDRVPDIETLAERQRALGRPIKPEIEVSRNGRVLQTAFKADPVDRDFMAAGDLVTRTVPGSFYEFIQRAAFHDEVADRERLDLTFDSSNAQGIFKMTR